MYLQHKKDAEKFFGVLFYFKFFCRRGGCQPDIPAIIRNTAAQAGFSPESIENRIQFTSPAAFQQAGGQCIAKGYACNETPELLPLALVLARRLATELTLARKTGAVPGLMPGGRAQVTVEYDRESWRLDSVALETARPPALAEDEFFYDLTKDVLAPALEILPPDEDTRILLRPAEVSPFLPHSSGPLSGKDPSWSEKAGRYMARYIAKNLVATINLRLLVRLCGRYTIACPIL